jgi:hypothetical protein
LGAGGRERVGCGGIHSVGGEGEGAVGSRDNGRPDSFFLELSVCVIRARAK